MGDKNRELIVMPDDGLEAVSRAIESAGRSDGNRRCAILASAALQPASFDRNY